MVDPELTTLLEDTAARNVAAVERLRDELLADRRRDDDRFAALDRELADLRAELGRVAQRCAALVLEEDGPDGELIVRARPARVGLDWRFAIGALLTLVTSGVVPILVAHAALQ